MSLATLRSSLLLLVAGLLVAAASQSASAQAYPVGNYYATNPSTYDTWYGNRHWLGYFALSNERAATALNGTQGSLMAFEKGKVFRIASGRHAGETYFVNGGINAKYIQMGSHRSKAGFPIGHAFRISPTAGHCQFFQGGTITWNVQQNQFVFYPYPLGDR